MEQGSLSRLAKVTLLLKKLKSLKTQFSKADITTLSNCLRFFLTHLKQISLDHLTSIKQVAAVLPEQLTLRGLYDCRDIRLLAKRL